jgi:Spy/CpxP family protein refolding chaperone
MFGFVVGTLCLVGFVKVWRYRGWHGYGPGLRGRRFGRRRHWFLYRAFQELETSPGQEKVIREAVSDLRESVEELRPQFETTRRDLANALRGDEFDSVSVEAALDLTSTQWSRLRTQIATTLGEIHEALDPDQRRRLARLVELGPAC